MEPGHVNFWSNIAFAFTGMELVCAMSEEVRDPKKMFPRAIYASGGDDRAHLHRRHGGLVGIAARRKD